MDKIIISVIMCVYNTPLNVFKEAVLSILNQTFINFELIIVDDASSTNLFLDDIFSDSRIRIIKNCENKGPSFCRNEALKISRGKYIAIMDSDDISEANRLEEQIKFLKANKNIVACGSWFRFIGNKTHEVKRTIPSRDYFRCCLLFNNEPTILNPSVMIPKKILDKNNISWNESLRLGEDYLMWVQLSEIGTIVNCDKILLNYRVHDTQSTSKNNRDVIGQNTWLIKKYQLDKIGIIPSEKKARMLSKSFVKSKKELNEIRILLEDIKNANKQSKYLNSECLEKRCNEQLIRLIATIKNPFIFLQIYFSKKYHLFAQNLLKTRFFKK